MTRLEEIKKLVIEGVQTDGAHHKQWYLEEILRLIDPIEAEFYEKYIGKEGIPP